MDDVLERPAYVGFIGVVYGFRLETSGEFRYVGMTSTSIRRRTQQHFKNAAAGRKTAFYDWLRKASEQHVYVESLEVVTSSLDDLARSEVAWIERLKAGGHRLLNLAEGGKGPNGYVWTGEQRKAAAIRATGRPGLHRFGPDSPMFGKHHSEEQKARWSEIRKGSITGEKNPNYGKFGQDHPGYGHTMSAESKAALAEQRRGAGNPNFGKSPSAETREKVSISLHRFHHTNKGVVKPECRHCVDDAAQSPTPPTGENPNG
ncbi:NUMOD3 domain-containing DNA-binding protein [Subtercola lobariae]|uniref:GIY-YIG domain-containing protein n=1 Tax=Subtercola lobariae TaxID=1588641 RepID=A0A917B1L4_9MICO|nr:NUMOD3 domain-containing DNA-binding protein [Subtercola lobariae]GGF12266.1 hypothetical protein GCM10011399_02760 [Subtercola lobariae]